MVLTYRKARDYVHGVWLKQCVNNFNWNRKLSRLQIIRLGQEGSREGDCKLSMTTRAHRWNAVWLHAWTQQHTRHIHCTLATRKQFMSIKHCTWPLSICKRHWIMYPDMLSGGLFPSSALINGWCSSYRACTSENTRSRVCLGCNLTEEFSVKMGVPHGSCLTPLLFITIPEALCQEFRTGCLWENMYAIDLAIITKSLEQLQQKLILWKTNMDKTKVLISGLGLDVLQKSVKVKVKVKNVLLQFKKKYT